MMGNVLYYYYNLLLTFTVIIMGWSNNYYYCEAATSSSVGGFVDVNSMINCGKALIEIQKQLAVKSDVVVRAPDGSESVRREFHVRESCKSAPKQLSGTKLVSCKCKIQALLAEGNPSSEVLTILNAIDNNQTLAQSCGFHQNCPPAIVSKLPPCEAAAREAMKTCEPMVKAAKENTVGYRDRQVCCSGLKKRRECSSCSSYTNVYNPSSIDVERANDLLRIANDTLLEECDFSTSLFTGSVCEVTSSIKNLNCFIKDTISVQHSCATSLKKPRIKASDIAAAPLPLIDARSPGCCSDKDSCRCDPISVKCCKKLGELSKNKWKSCMCDLLNNDPSSKTIDSATLEFLKFVNSNYNMFWSCFNYARDLQDSCKPSHGFDGPKKKTVPTLRPFGGKRG